MIYDHIFLPKPFYREFCGRKVEDDDGRIRECSAPKIDHCCGLCGRTYLNPQCQCTPGHFDCEEDDD